MISVSDCSLVVLSPHLDDAVLSVGALIAGRVAAGDSVQVLSVYTAGPPADSLRGRQRVFGDYAVRFAEDERALAVLGAEHRRLGLRERLFRDPPLSRTLEVFRTPPTAAGLGELDAVHSVIVALLSDPQVLVLAPLGIGNHVDHVEVAVAAMRAVLSVGAPDRIVFYEDFYALSHGCRRRHPVSRSAPVPWGSAPVWASPIAGIRLQALSWVSKGPASSDYLGLSPTRGGTDDQNCGWTAEAIAVGNHEKAKLCALREYRTQMRVLGGEHRVSAMIRRSHARRGGEVLWHLAPR